MKQQKIVRRTPDQGSPSFGSRPPLPLSEFPAPPQLEGMVNAANSYLRCYRLGECSVIVTKEFARWHLSIAHPRRYPNWDEIAEARYRLLPDSITAAMILPPKNEYINRHENCFQIIEIDPVKEPLFL